MARNNIRRVPPPTAYFGTVDVTVEPSDDALFFTSVDDAIEYLINLPEDINPLTGIPWAIRLHPGLLSERFDLPTNVGLFGVSPVGSIIRGGPDVQAGDAVVGVHNGTLSNVLVWPNNVTGNPETNVWIKNSKSVYTKRESDWTLSLNTRQLIITPNGFPQETFIFTATEVDAASVAAFINTNGVNIKAAAIHNQVEITPIPDTFLTVDKTGTANVVFGFSQTVDQKSVTNDAEFLVVDNVQSLGDSNLNKSVYFGDDGGGIYILSRIRSLGGQHGIYFEDGGFGIVENAYIRAQITAGVFIGDNALAEFEGGSSKLNGTDVIIGSGAELVARAFTYKTITNNGILTPSGSRITFEWNYGGILLTGTNIDGMRPIPHDITIESVQVARRLNGSGGATIIDLNEGNSGATPSTLYTTQANRPTIDWTQGDWVVELAALPDVLEVNKGSYLTIDVDAVEAGAGPAAPADLYVVVTAVVN